MVKTLQVFCSANRSCKTVFRATGGFRKGPNVYEASKRRLNRPADLSNTGQSLLRFHVRSMSGNEREVMDSSGQRNNAMAGCIDKKEYRRNVDVILRTDRGRLLWK